MSSQRPIYLLVAMLSLVAPSFGSTIRLSPEQHQRAGISTTRVIAQDSATSLRVVGSLVRSPDATNLVRSPVSGRIELVAVEPGTRVQRGQLLMVVHSHELHDLSAELRLSEREREMANNRLESGRRLLELEGISRLELERREQEALRASLAVDAIRVELEDLGLTTKEIDELTVGSLHGELPVRSPFPGVVLEVLARSEERVQPWSPLLSIGDPNRLELDLQVQPDLAQWVSVGDLVRFAPIGVSARFDAVVVTRVPDVDPTTRTVRIRAHVEQLDARLIPGMFVEGELHPTSAPTEAMGGDEGAPVALVPESALVRIDGGDVVFVEVDDLTYEIRRLRLGPGDGRMVPVFEGVSVGEAVVSEGAFLLKSEAVRGSEPDGESDGENGEGELR